MVGKVNLHNHVGVDNVAFANAQEGWCRFGSLLVQHLLNSGEANGQHHLLFVGKHPIAVVAISLVEHGLGQGHAQ